MYRDGNDRGDGWGSVVDRSGNRVCAALPKKSYWGQRRAEAGATCDEVRLPADARQSVFNHLQCRICHLQSMRLRAQATVLSGACALASAALHIAPALRLVGPVLTPMPAPQVTELQEALLTTTPAFLYRPSHILSQADYRSPTTLQLYDGGGYAHDFDAKNETSFDQITKLLRRAAWLDGATRIVVVELALYNPPTDLLATAFFLVRCCLRHLHRTTIV